MAKNGDRFNEEQKIKNNFMFGNYFDLKSDGTYTFGRQKSKGCVKPVV